MSPVGERTEPVLEWALLGVETVFPFSVEENKTINIQPRTDSVGFMELHTLEGGPIFCWRGVKAPADCLADLLSPLCTFDLGASVGQKGEIKIEPGLSQLTIFAKKASIGFLRVREFPLC